LDVFQGPFDLLLALVMREEIELAEVPIAEIVVAFVERMQERGEIDLESASEFLVLVAALLEIKVRLLFPDDEEDLEELTAEQAEAELIERLIEYRRYAAAARSLGARVSDARVFRTGPAPLAPRPDPVVEAFSEDPWQLHAVIGRLLTPPPKIDISSVRRRLVPVSEFLSRFRALLRERRGFAFEEAVAGLDRLSQAAAFLAVLELYKAGEADPVQDELFGPIRVARGSGRAAAQPAPAASEPQQADRAIA
ncbi:MAG TPA: segregation/condensation protein A, partial [Gaiellales bacterium]|nr:segregation/condensation protein A [Gaiellales bacterium]